MFPTLLEIGPIQLHMYGLMIAVGFLTALQFMRKDAQERLGIAPDDMTQMALWALFWGVLGTRILHIIMFPQAYSWNDPIGWIAVWNGGLVFQGALPTALAYAIWTLRRRKISFWGMADVVFPWIPLAQAFGRMGCFFNGCCFGIRSDVPWALQFPPGSPPHSAHYANGALHTQDWSHAIHPSQLYSVMLLLTMAIVLFLFRMRWEPFRGALLPLYFMLYGVKRFIVEMYRGDGNPTGLGFGFFTDQQVFSLLFVVLGIGLFIWLWRTNKQGASVKSAT